MDIKFIRWERDGGLVDKDETIGYNVYDYFVDGKYSGPDSDGIYPVWEMDEMEIDL